MRIEAKRIRPYTICWWGVPGHVGEVYMDPEDPLSNPATPVTLKHYNLNKC